MTKAKNTKSQRKNNISKKNGEKDLTEISNYCRCRSLFIVRENQLCNDCFSSSFLFYFFFISILATSSNMRSRMHAECDGRTHRHNHFTHKCESRNPFIGSWTCNEFLIRWHLTPSEAGIRHNGPKCLCVWYGSGNLAVAACRRAAVASAGSFSAANNTTNWVSRPWGADSEAVEFNCCSDRKNARPTHDNATMCNKFLISFCVPFHGQKRAAVDVRTAPRFPWLLI